jgi:hypothetical protein
VPPYTHDFFDILPHGFMTHRGINETFWLHVEGDSTVLRAEKEELVLLLNNGSPERVRAQPVACVDPIDGSTTVTKEACGSPNVLPALLRHTAHLINLYWWDVSERTQNRVFVSFSSLGATQPWCRYAQSYCESPRSVAKAGPDCRDRRRYCHLMGSCSVAAEATGPCASFPGTGKEYYSRMMRHVGRIVGLSEPSSIVIAHSGLHYARRRAVARTRDLPQAPFPINAEQRTVRVRRSGVCRGVPKDSY